MGNEQGSGLSGGTKTLGSMATDGRIIKVENVDRKVRNLTTITTSEQISSFFISEKHQRLVTFHESFGSFRIWDLQILNSQENEPLMEMRDVDHVLKFDEEMFFILYLGTTISKVCFQLDEDQPKLTRIFTPENNNDKINVDSITSLIKLSNDLIGAPDNHSGKIFIFSISEKRVSQVIETGSTFLVKTLKSKNTNNSNCFYHNYNQNMIRLYDFEKKETILKNWDPFNDEEEEGTNEEEEEETNTAKAIKKQLNFQGVKTIELIKSFLNARNEEILIVGGKSFGFRFYITSSSSASPIKTQNQVDEVSKETGTPVNTETESETIIMENENDQFPECFMKTDFYSSQIHLTRLGRHFAMIGLNFVLIPKNSSSISLSHKQTSDTKNLELFVFSNIVNFPKLSSSSYSSSSSSSNQQKQPVLQKKSSSRKKMKKKCIISQLINKDRIKSLSSEELQKMELLIQSTTHLKLHSFIPKIDPDNITIRLVDEKVSVEEKRRLRRRLVKDSSSLFICFSGEKFDEKMEYSFKTIGFEYDEDVI